MDQNIFIDYRVTMPVKLLHGTVWNDVRWYGTICGTLTRGQWPNRRAASESMEVKSGLRFEMSDLNYLHIHVHIAYILLILVALRPLQPPNSLGGQI